MRRRFSPFTLALGAGLVLLVACKDKDLAITNPNAGDTKRVLATPTDAENLLGNYFKRWHSGLYGSANPPTTFEGMSNVMSLQHCSSLANNCQNIRTPFTGAGNVNTPGNPCAGEQYNPFQVMNEVNRVASNFLGVVDGFTSRQPRRGNSTPR